MQSGWVGRAGRVRSWVGHGVVSEWIGRFEGGFWVGRVEEGGTNRASRKRPSEKIVMARA